MSEYVTKFASFEDFEVKTKKDGSLAIVGYGSVLHHQDLQGDVLERGVFSKSLEESKTKGRMPKMFYEHNNKHVCGVWTEANEDEYGLRLQGSVFSSEKEIIDQIKNGAVSGLSVGFHLLKSFLQNNVRYITSLELVEVSLVSRPANEHARFFPRHCRVEHATSRIRRPYGFA